MNPWRGVAGLPREVWALAATTFVNRIGTMVIPFLVLYLTGPLGFSSALAGSIVGVFGLTSIVAAPISGRLADRFGATRVMGASLVLSAAVLALYPLVRGVAPVIAATVLFAAVSEAYRPASLSAVSLAAGPEQRKAAFALNRLAINLGMSVGPALGGFLASWSFAALFWVDGASSLAAAAVLAWAPVRAAEGAAPPAGGAAPAGRPSLLGEAWRDLRLRYFLAAGLPALVVFFQLTAALPLFLVRDLGFTAAFYGALFTLNTLIIVALEVPLNVAMADWPAGRQLALGAALVACGFGGMALTSGRAGIALTVVVWTFGEMVLFPAMAAYVAEIAPETRSGEYMGLFTMTFGFALVLAPPIGTFLLDRFGGGVLWTAMLALGLASAALLARVRR
ncbi:MAG: MFS transporter [Acidobacteria bacterium]|jgi:MFS family permease|nr:MFS transporter [Acidobacteriota bacterium]